MRFQKSNMCLSEAKVLFLGVAVLALCDVCGACSGNGNRGPQLQL